MAAQLAASQEGLSSVSKYVFVSITMSSDSKLDIITECHSVRENFMVVDVRGWWFNDDGSSFAGEGGFAIAQATPSV
jgi:hypothetical protein